MNSVTGAGVIEIGGEQRPIVFDMDAADALYEAVGPHWNLWLIERFLPQAMAKKGEAVHLKALSPADQMIAVYALCAGDRRDRGYVETLDEMRRKTKPFELGGMQAAITRAVLASFGAPGEGLEVVASADDASPSDAHAQTHGTGTQS